MTGAALAPLAARYGSWLGLSEHDVLEDREEAEQDIRALQLLVRMERDDPPSWHRAVALAARGAAAVCLDPRAEPGGDWYAPVLAYCTGHIRKVTRRARGAQWAATADLPGLSFDDHGTQVRALLPGRVTELDRTVTKLQVGGTDVDVDAPPAEWSEPGADGPDLLTVWVDPHHPMTLGKTMAQTGHAGMIAAALLAADPAGASELARWITAGLPVRAIRPDPAGWDALVGPLADPAAAWSADRMLSVRDAGFTEVPPGTVTAVARFGARGQSLSVR